MDGLLGLSIPYLDQIELAFYFKLMTCWLVMMNDIVTKDMTIVAISLSVSNLTICSS